MPVPASIHKAKSAIDAIALTLSLLILSGCAGIPSGGRTVQQIEIDSVADLPPAARRLYKSADLQAVHGAQISRDDGQITSQSLNYLVGMLSNVPQGARLGSFTAQVEPKLSVVLLNNGSNCTVLPKRIKSSLADAVRSTLRKAGNPMPRGKVEIHLVAPVTRMYSLTTFRSRKPRIHLSFYFTCVASRKPAYLEYHLAQAIGGALHELTHAAFQWHGQGDGGEATVSGANACFIAQLKGFDPKVMKQLSASWTLDARANEARSSSDQPRDLQAACRQWSQTMRQLDT